MLPSNAPLSTSQTYNKNLSNLFINLFDLLFIFSLKEFRNSCRDEDALVKLLVFPSDDGGSDEVLKNQQSLSSLSKIFVNNDLDALIVFNQAPASSGYNPVKRRMASLIRDTAGLTLPFDKLLSHLNPPNETIDVEIEK